MPQRVAATFSARSNSGIPSLVRAAAAPFALGHSPGGAEAVNRVGRAATTAAERPAAGRTSSAAGPAGGSQSPGLGRATSTPTAGGTPSLDATPASSVDRGVSRTLIRTPLEKASPVASARSSSRHLRSAAAPYAFGYSPGVLSALQLDGPAARTERSVAPPHSPPAGPSSDARSPSRVRAAATAFAFGYSPGVVTAARGIDVAVPGVEFPVVAQPPQVSGPASSARSSSRTRSAAALPFAYGSSPRQGQVLVADGAWKPSPAEPPRVARQGNTATPPSAMLEFQHHICDYCSQNQPSSFKL